MYFTTACQALISDGSQYGDHLVAEETLAYPVHARYLRFYGNYHLTARLRLQVYGCSSDESIGEYRESARITFDNSLLDCL